MDTAPSRKESALVPDVDPRAQATPVEPGAPRPNLEKLGRAFRARAAVRSLSTTLLLVLAVIYTLHFARAFVLPIVFALLLDFLFAPVVRSLHRVGIGPAVGSAVVLASLCLLVGLAGYSLADSVREWTAKAPSALAGTAGRLRQLTRPLERVSRTAEQVERATTVAPAQRATEVVVRGPSLLERLFGQTQSLAAGVLEVLILLYFLLGAGDLFLQKLIKVLPEFEEKKTAVQIARETEASISAYLVTVSLINVVLGGAAAGMMFALGMPNPVLWGVLAFVLEYMPYIGATIMVAVLTVAGLSTFSNVGHALLVPLSYFVLTSIQANFVSPVLLGRRLTLNPVAILVGMAFWYEVWGLAGAFIAVPLIATFKILCDHIESLAPIGEFLGR